MYRVYLRKPNQTVDFKTVTKSKSVAKAAFEELVGDKSFDGESVAAVLSYNNGQLAYHRFDRSPGYADYWRNRLDEINWPE